MAAQIVIPVPSLAPIDTKISDVVTTGCGGYRGSGIARERIPMARFNFPGCLSHLARLVHRGYSLGQPLSRRFR